MSERAMTTMGVREGRKDLAAAAGTWWLFLITGGAWLLFSVIVFRFDYRSVNAIAILFGLTMMGAAVNELLSLAGSTRGWRIAHVLLALIFVVIGIVAFVHPGNTFKALAAVISFYFIVKGGFDIALGFAFPAHRWLRIIGGIAELLLGLWAAAYWGRSATLLLAWIGVLALIRGVTEIAFAFTLRQFREATN
jgi:uncharacterized membrane protein HdeD (DUF308 family)